MPQQVVHPRRRDVVPKRLDRDPAVPRRKPEFVERQRPSVDSGFMGRILAVAGAGVKDGRLILLKLRTRSFPITPTAMILRPALESMHGS